MKITNRNARMDRAGKHNDRNFNLDNAPHIDQSKLQDNIYYTYNGDTEHTFAEIEQEFYDRHFSEFLDSQNKKNEEIRHKERNRSVEDYAKGKRTRPEDKILQIGNKNEHASKEELWECAMEYMRRFDEIFGEHCKILDMALHMDEATPHVHIRRVWIAENENGMEYVSQKKALEQLGIMDPDQSRPNSKYNNAKMTFTQSDIKLFRDICIEKGLDIDLTPPEKRSHLSTLEYKKKILSEEIDELERTRDSLGANVQETKEAMDGLDDILDEMVEYFDNNPFFEERYAEELKMAKERDRAGKFRILAEIYNTEAESVIHSTDDFDKAAIRADLENDLRHIKDFIKDKGLEGEYEEYNKARLDRHNIGAPEVQREIKATGNFF